MSARILDGGFASALEAGGFDPRGPLWAARAILEAPDRAIAVHAAFSEAGAAVACTGSYQLSREALGAVGRDPAEAPRWFARSVELARAGSRGEVWLSLGPYGAGLGDRSEYHGRYAISDRGLLDHWRVRLEDARQAGADRWLFETIPSQREAEIIRRAAEEARLEVPLALSFSAKDGRSTAYGEPIEVAARALVGGGFSMVGVNCAAPEVVLSLLDHLARAGTGLGLIAYPNGPSSLEFSDFARRALAAGASVIGGCCGVGVAEIRGIAAALSGP